MISAARRQFVTAGAAVLGAGLAAGVPGTAFARDPGAQTMKRPATIEKLGGLFNGPTMAPGAYSRRNSRMTAIGAVRKI
jgi:hypothetical protein